MNYESAFKELQRDMAGTVNQLNEVRKINGQLLEHLEKVVSIFADGHATSAEYRQDVLLKAQSTIKEAKGK